jgi:chemotaxis protein MotB
MLQKTIIVSAIAASLLFCSCAARKRLEAANADLNTQVAQLKTANADLQNGNAALSKQIDDMKANDQMKAQQFAKYQQDCQASQQRLKDVQAALDEQYAALQDLKAKISAALADFADKGVDVYYKNGLVYVDMQEGLLYKSGSSKLGDKGKSALSSLSNVLNNYPNLKVIVLGNTDSVKFKGGFDNWSLSTERANGVVRILRDEYKVDPMRLTSSGRGKYNPVADNSTPEGRAKNRRTEIILNPDLEKLWESVQK